MVLDEQGNLFVTGSVDGAGDYFDVQTRKLAPDGTVLWSAGYDGPATNIDRAVAIGRDAAGNIYVAADSVGNGTGIDFVLLKYDPNGHALWTLRYNGPGNG